MKKIELKKLSLSNWRGQNVKIEFNEECTTIKGQNGKGKTSIMSAWFWLLSSYTDTILPKNSNLFDDTKTLSKDTPHAIVEAELLIDGSEWKIKREAIASFKLNKGTGEWEKQQGIYSCSICGKACPYDVQADIIQYWICNYCPNCGADMTRGAEDG
jgi:predicted ATP-binding protein involved in virulence